MPGVAVLAALPFNVHNGAQPSDFEHRIRRGKTGEQRELKQREGEDAETAGTPQSRRNRLHGYAAKVTFRTPRGGLRPNAASCVRRRKVSRRRRAV